MSLTVSPQQLAEIRRHGEADYPHECCGLLIGSFGPDGAKIAKEIFPIGNAREEAAKHFAAFVDGAAKNNAIGP